VIETPGHIAASVQDAVPRSGGDYTLELVPRDLSSDHPLGLGLSPLKLIDASSGEPIANAAVNLAAAGTVEVDLRSNALGYIFVDEEDFTVLLKDLRITVPSYRTRAIGYESVVLLQPAR
jgi:hypothetical protein